MTVISEHGERVFLPRMGREDFWKTMHEHYAGDHPGRWKSLAILALRENAGWPLETIGAVFGHHRGHVSRILKRVKSELRETFEQSPEWLGMGDEEEWSERGCSERGFSNPNRESGQC
ncbi:sigma factor-like helix-turn-helix DNA-binding protein [Rubinisphaera sp.]|uniref:sigma factor-like helix-turn-helix DNA-binding protein n=1 Tax=Rubinisphaera sp. TaxID=2024857 RepID=UPI000C111674|nr:sigma factor-like helix-turn-helix DNA-binding protein [Rubinisphaera sp.]MBV12047.1 hypothetical protein [Rubinisphaera sp.]HCS54478.1 hypothetical protein [Planctomycetaceae bacterium]|tara:strand:+ start:4216 stop:4569 length:354 start_codon:yes stop_codon:yes gene_type:complete